jgi:hypothetical protein
MFTIKQASKFNKKSFTYSGKLIYTGNIFSKEARDIGHTSSKQFDP